MRRGVVERGCDANTGRGCESWCVVLMAKAKAADGGRPCECEGDGETPALDPDPESFLDKWDRWVRDDWHRAYIMKLGKLGLDIPPDIFECR